MSVAADRAGLDRPRRVHLLGVCGTGMSAYATVLAQAGHEVTGSDVAPDPAVAARLGGVGVVVRTGHAAANVPPGAEVVARSTAVADDNPELAEAARRGLPVLGRAELLSALCAGRDAVAVAGTHGKTTTTALLALALRGAGLRPSFLVGADVPGLDHGAHWEREGRLLVVEADESDRTFLALPRSAALVLNVEADHLAAYGGSFDRLREAFARFAAETPGPVVTSADDPVAAALPAAATFGLSPAATFRLEDLRLERLGSRFRLTAPGRGPVPVALPAAGAHNAANAAAALAMAATLGADLDEAAAALAGWTGVSRRFQVRGERAGATVVDDYAHLPGEVRSVLAAARAGGWPRVVCVFQPHRYSRTEEVHRQFAGAFDLADVLVVTGIYAPAGEEPRPGVTGRLVLDAAAHREASYVEERGRVAEHVRRILRPGDLLLTLGAGDITRLADELEEA